MRGTYTITEYGSFVKDKEVIGYTSLPCDTFEALEEFVLSNSNKEVDALELMGLSARKGIGKIITARNYVGVITMEDGTTIEILPKIHSKEESTEVRTKKLLVDMLKTLKKFPFKSLQTTNVNAEKMDIFEVFIRMFIDEVFGIVKRGIKSSYETVQSNEKVFKGKMKFDGQIKYNYAHKERCFVEFDEFNVNRPENKILKVTLQYLYKKSHSSKNKNDIKTLLNSFTEVNTSTDYETDFSKIVPDRNMKDYSAALMWSEVFLKGKSFTSFAGSKIAFALLFPMEALFESYIAKQLKKELDLSCFSISAQDRTYHLFDEPTRKFLMKPDIVIRNKETKAVYILDTKWKVLSNDKSNYGISQSDMYQMYAYQKKYSAKNVTLIYPFTDRISIDNDIEFRSVDDVIVKVKFVDLFNVKNSLARLVSDLLSDDSQIPEVGGTFV
ncbi:McrC family protein [Frisingicoccus sp.]